ncbi:hypothetical protein BLX41_19290 [Pseudomonas protegens]|uniref:DUF2971 domain-containing protein n=1 Tax=Pseudomonas protegens TaxID=380021 RepID=UPI000F4B47BC|nr:DUF2971 domain-containing protein [Pseudomonas protegens]ROL71812.1 hypothetical protein BLX41_19290 [Pseudomonas protegens]
MFKYFGAERVSIFQDRLIRFSQPGAFNDPFEFLPSIESVSTDEEFGIAIDDVVNMGLESEYEALDAFYKEKITFDQFQSLMREKVLDLKRDFNLELKAQLGGFAQKTLFEGCNERIGVLCLSENKSDLLMWAHYADCHKGFVIEFDSNSTFFDQRRSVNDEMRHLRKVKYKKTRPSTVLSQATSEDIFLTKSDHWEYEAEWRMLMPLLDATKEIVLPAGRVCLFEFPASVVKSVTFGARMDSEQAVGVMKSIVEDRSYRGVEFYQSKIHQSEYGLVFEKIELLS